MGINVGYMGINVGYRGINVGYRGINFTEPVTRKHSSRDIKTNLSDDLTNFTY